MARSVSCWARLARRASARALEHYSPMTTTSDIRKVLAAVSGFIAIGLDGLSALGFLAGLGLLVALGIIQDHGGWINVESDVGKGSVFKIYLPSF